MKSSTLIKSLSITAFICTNLIAAAQSPKSQLGPSPKIKSPVSVTEVNPGAGPIIKILSAFLADDSTTLKRSMDKDYKVTSRFVSFSGETTAFNVSEDNGILIFENPETHEQKRYKVILNKARKKVITIKNIETGRICLPAPFEGGSISG